MIIGIVCKCKCTKEFIINISETNILDSSSMKIYNEWECSKCTEKPEPPKVRVLKNLAF
ncbi:hypothetical protein LCGC14_0502960 [marine sediment metagenome]|uniref:Uncharacterized protein n=1 Tax=marine sediment metagenome TaxID=412755 RepID=A0A0F9VC30_9ZZZZ